MFKINATKLRDSSIANVVVYPPVASKILFDNVAIRDPPITVKVISAILLEKYFIPKNDEVNAAVIVGQAPYDIPVKHKPAMHRESEPTETAINVTVAAHIVNILANNIVLRRPMMSNKVPVRILPRPLHTDNTPTRETANDSEAFTDKAKSLAKLITELPTAAKNEMQMNAIQNEGRLSI